jgi:ankyrin repeat protein
MVAAKEGQADMVEYLVGRPGIDIDAKTAKGHRSVHIACQAGHLECSSLFKVRAVPNLGREPLRETLRSVPTKS